MELETASPTFGTLQQEDDFFFLPQAVQSQDSPKVHQIRNNEYIDTESAFKNNLFKTNFSVSTHGSIEPALKAMDFNTVPSHHYKNEGIRPLNYHSATNRTSKHQHTDSDPSNADTDNTFGSLSPSSTRSSGAKNVDTSSRPYTSYAGKLKVKYEQVEEEEEDEDEFHAYSDNEEPTVPSLRPQASNQSMREKNSQAQHPSRGLRINEADEPHQNQNQHLRPSPSLPLRSGSLEPHGGGGREREDASSLVGIRSQSSMRAPSFDGSERDHDNTVRFAGSLGNKSNGRRHEEPNDYSRLRQTIRDVHAREEEDANYRDQDDDDDKFYRRATHRSKLLEFIPTALAEPVHQRSCSYGVAHLPDWNTIRPGELTSQPISNVKKDMDWSLRRLISRTVFEQLLSNNLGRHRFREYLVRAEGTETQLDLLFDMIQFQKMVAVVKDSAEALHDVYLASDSVHHQRLPVEIDEGVFKSVKTAFDLKLGGMADAQNHLLSNFYANEFQRFIKNQLIEQTKVAFNSDAFDPNDNEMKGLGDCYCLTNPRLRENPIVLVSDGFTAITGYKREQIIGRNCRFLQGPSTSPASIQRIRDALNAGEPLTELILNYKLNGDPFWNLLNLIPLRSRDGSLAYFIGSQTNVTGTLAGGKLSFLTAGMNEEKTEEVKNLVNGREVSSTMARHLGAEHAAGTGVEAVSYGHGSIASRSSTQNRRGGAAGAYDPSKDSQHGYNSNMNVGMLAPPPGMEGGSISKKSGFMKMFGGKGGSSNQALQRVPGAEATIPMRNKVGNLEDQMDLFSQQTSKLIIFRRQKREVLFATPELVKYFGLPIATSRQILASPLIHADLLSLVRGNDKEDTKFLRSKVSAAISKGEGLSIRIGIRKPSKKWSLGKKDQQDLIITWTTLVLTPLMDRDNSSFAMIALFG